MSKLSLLLVAFAVTTGAMGLILRSPERKARLVGMAGRLGRHKNALRVWGPAALGVLGALWFGMPAMRVAREARAERERAERVRTTAEQMRRDFAPATSAETAEWARTKTEIAEFGVPSVQRLTLTHAIARLAEDSGLDRVRIRVTSPDSAPGIAPRVIGGREFVPSSYRLSLTADGHVGAAASLVTALPPSVEIQRLEVAGSRIAYLLAVFEQAPGAQ